MTGPRNADGKRGKMGRRLYAHVSPVCARIGQLKAVICAKHLSEEKHALIAALCIKDLICSAFRNRFRCIAMTCWALGELFPIQSSLPTVAAVFFEPPEKGPSRKLACTPKRVAREEFSASPPH